VAARLTATRFLLWAYVSDSDDFALVIWGQLHHFDVDLVSTGSAFDLDRHVVPFLCFYFCCGSQLGAAGSRVDS
jgi:hypothetical protein